MSTIQKPYPRAVCGLVSRLSAPFLDTFLTLAAILIFLGSRPGLGRRSSQPPQNGAKNAPVPRSSRPKRSFLVQNSLDRARQRSHRCCDAPQMRFQLEVSLCGHPSRVSYVNRRIAPSEKPGSRPGELPCGEDVTSVGPGRSARGSAFAELWPSAWGTSSISSLWTGEESPLPTPLFGKPGTEAAAVDSSVSRCRTRRGRR